jgi:hypothetical protein
MRLKKGLDEMRVRRQHRVAERRREVFVGRICPFRVRRWRNVFLGAPAGIGNKIDRAGFVLYMDAVFMGMGTLEQKM